MDFDAGAGCKTKEGDIAMKTAKQVRARLAEFEDRFEARLEKKAKVRPGRDVQGDRALELEMLGSWIGALKWILGEGVER